MYLEARKQRRKRGVILTTEALDKFQAARAEQEFQHNSGRRYTLEDLSDRTSLSVDTLMKIFAREVGVDKQTLKCCFKAFNLTLEHNDYFLPEAQVEEIVALEPTLALSEPEFPGGQVPLGSPRYIERLAMEAEIYKAVLQPGALIRIKAPRRMGKTSLMVRILDRAAQNGYRSVSLSFQLAERSVFQSLEKLLQWMCATVSLGLGLPNQLADYWDDLFGSKVSCKMYFEQYLLVRSPQPLILGLDDVDRLFEYPELADDFLGLLRAWHEEAKNREIWKRLHLVVAHSSEVYIPLNKNQSPFNVGVPIELPELTGVQIVYIAKLYGLEWSLAEAEGLMSLVGGHPYLVQLALYHLWRGDITLEELLRPSSTPEIYRHHLQGQLWNLQQNQQLAAAFSQALATETPVQLDLIDGFKLQSLGLVRLQADRAIPGCELYTRYFRSYFSIDRLPD